jgi:hypothetical protein
MADWTPEIADPLVHAHLSLLQPIYKRFFLGRDLCVKRCSCESAYDLPPNRLQTVTLRIASPEDVTFA